jgi:D-alanine-D-alanine ligase
MSLDGLSVGVVFGGANSEHDVSVTSARSIIESLRLNGASVRPIYVAKDGAWRDVGAAPAPDQSWSSGLDAVFPIIHGSGGEDGTLQGALEIAGVPFVGSGVLASALAMDKWMSTRLLNAAELPTVETRRFRARDRADDVALARLLDGLSFPLFVKPNRAGSSFGASRVERRSELRTAFDAAFAEDSVALIQPFVDAREVSIGILETATGEIVASGASLVHLATDQPFFTHDGKYGGGDSWIEIPAPLPVTLTIELQELARDVFETLGCRGLARVDFFVDRNDEIVINEVNTLPGFGRNSHYPRLMREAGIDFDDLVETLVRAALQVGAREVGAYETAPAELPLQPVAESSIDSQAR